MEVLDTMRAEGHEQVVFFHDRESGLRCIIAIHDTTLGPAVGGTRMWNHPSEAAALTDVLRLSRAMTYKASLAGLDLGGGKGIILGDPHKDKSPVLLRAYGRCVESLGGRYITAEDVGTAPEDLEVVMGETRFMVGRPMEMGGSGDSAPPTGFGVFQGMRACAAETFGEPSLKGRTVALQGFGKVASNLARYLLEDGASLVVTDTYGPALDRARREFGARVVKPDAIFDEPCDVFSPNALGGVLNRDVIPRLRCRIVAGGANNQLLEREDGDRLREAGILYAPDYLINAGGLISLSLELTRYDAKVAMACVGRIYETMERVIATAREEETTTARAADLLAERRLEKARRRRSER